METVIQEIANQLGMAVDQAGQFITEQLPNFAAIKVVQNVTTLVIVAVALIACAAAVILSYRFNTKSYMNHNYYKKEEILEETHYWCSAYRWEFASFYVLVFFAILAIISFLCAIFVCADAIPNIIGWSNYPEAMLIDMALKAVG